MTRQIERLRGKIDEINHRLLWLMNERARLSSSVISEKRHGGLPVRDPAREDAILDGISRTNRGPLSSAQVRLVYRQLIDACVESADGRALVTPGKSTMKLSVPCNFDEQLLDGLRGYPVYEIFGKVTADYAGGGRPSFYLPSANKRTVERFVRKAHAQNIEFNYLLNASCMSNAEYTREGNRQIRATLDWVAGIGVDSVTVGQIYLLQLIKRCYPHLKVRISAHRFTDSPRKAKFWEDHGADCIVLNETAFAREFGALRAIRSAVNCDLSMIVNNSCRQDCAIAGTHACSLSHASQRRRGVKNNLPLDYHMLFCLDLRLREPVNYVRANWIRPEDTPHYEAMGISNFKIVERNTPTPELLRRVKAYSERRYEGNLLDLVLPFQYPEESYSPKAAREAYGMRRAVKYFFKPGQVNVLKVPKLAALGRRIGLLYPRRGPSPLYLDNRKLDGFIDQFLKRSCIDLDCEKCGYCHRYADEALSIDPEYKADALRRSKDLFEDMHTGTFWQPAATEAVTEAVGLAARAGKRVGQGIGSRVARLVPARN